MKNTNKEKNTHNDFNQGLYYTITDVPAKPFGQHRYDSLDNINNLIKKVEDSLDKIDISTEMGRDIFRQRKEKLDELKTLVDVLIYSAELDEAIKRVNHNIKMKKNR